MKKNMYPSVCQRDLKFNGGLLRCKVLLELEFGFLGETVSFSARLRNLKFSGGLLRCKVILDLEILLSVRDHIFLRMPSGSEIQGWLVAI